MASFRVPLTADTPYYEQATDLGETTYRLRLAYNSRSDSWTLGLRSAAGADLVMGRRLRLAPGEDHVLRQYVGVDLPTARLTMPDLDASHIEPGREDLGERVELRVET